MRFKPSDSMEYDGFVGDSTLSMRYEMYQPGDLVNTWLVVTGT